MWSFTCMGFDRNSILRTDRSFSRISHRDLFYVFYRFPLWFTLASQVRDLHHATRSTPQRSETQTRVEQLQSDARQPAREGERRHLQGRVSPKARTRLFRVAGEIAPLRVECEGGYRLQSVVQKTQKRPQGGQLIPHPEAEQAQMVLAVYLQRRLSRPRRRRSHVPHRRRRRSAAS